MSIPDYQSCRVEDALQIKKIDEDFFEWLSWPEQGAI